MHIQSLGYLGVTTPEPKLWESFAQDILGTPLAEPGPDGSVRLRLDDRHHRLAIHPGERNRLEHLGWEMAHELDLDALSASVAAAGFEVHRGTDAEVADRCVRRFDWFLDPSGVRHELFTGQLDLPKTFLPTKPLSGFVTGSQGVGHVALATPDMARAKSFYTGVMGFTLSDEIDLHVPLAFLRCNPRHHSLALGQVANMRGILHLMIQVAELDDVGMAYDRCLTAGLPIYRTIGRHTNDRMVSFYVRTPGGFDVEYGWGAVEVHDEARAATVMVEGSIWGHHLSPDPMRPGAIEPA